MGYLLDWRYNQSYNHRGTDDIPVLYEIEREAVVYDAPDVIMERIEKLETEIQSALVELKKMM